MIQKPRWQDCTRNDKTDWRTYSRKLLEYVNELEKIIEKYELEQRNSETVKQSESKTPDMPDFMKDIFK